MSDLCMSALEDIVWEEFGQSDDHIVPHPGDEHGNENAFQSESSKKLRREVIGVSSNAGDWYAARFVNQGKEEGYFPTLKNRRDTMLENDSWSHTPGGVFPASCDSDSIKEETSLASDNLRMSSHCFKSSNIDSIGSELCADDPIIGDRCAAVDSNSYRYPLGHISQTDSDLSFLDNDREDKESSDLLYYAWPDIGNFEDVDRMFRSCDSTFGLEGVGNEDELGWFSSSHAIEVSEDVLTSDFKFSCPELSPSKNIPDHHEPSKLNNASSSINDSNMDSASVSYKCSSRTSEDDEPAALGHLSFVNASNTISESKDKFTPKEQGVEFNGGIQFKISTINHSKNDNNAMTNLHKKQSKHVNQSEGKRKGRCLENCGSFHHISDPQFKDIKLPSGDSSHQVFPSPNIPQQTQNMGSDSFGFLQTHIPYMHSDYRYHSDQIPVSPTLSGIKSENNGLTSHSPKESSYASNQVQSMESSHDRSFEAPAITMDKKREKPHLRQGFQPSFTSNRKHVDLVVPAAICDPVSCRKQVHHSENKVEIYSEVEGVSMGIPELDSSNVQERSSMSSGLDEISLETTSFRQLQHVMEQLDIRTKLCIRDSLYRLARSAEQRHNYVNLNGGSRDDRETSGALMDEETNKCTGFMDMETNTNPIDRSIAHLLFHRPSDSSMMPAYDSKSQTMIHGSTTSPPVMAEKLVCQEETATAADVKVADH
uniref:Protein LNK1 n=1 Tax=Davidia involucrata TaxID=16924 RepID=A0A5B6Z960_DAVIN